MKYFQKFKNDKELVLDSILAIGVLIIVGTTLALNIYIGMYLIGLILIGLAFFLHKTS